MLDWITHVRAGANELLHKRLSAGVSSLSHFLSEREKAAQEGRTGAFHKLEHLRDAYRQYSDQSEKAHQEFMEHVRGYCKEKVEEAAEAEEAALAEAKAETKAKTGKASHGETVVKHS